MAGEPRILIAGGSGVFGRVLARELLKTTSARLVIAARDAHRAAAVCRSLAAPHRVEPLALDLAIPGDLSRAAQGCFAVACTAGPFKGLPAELPRVAVEAGAHWLDIADDPRWLLPLLSRSALGRDAEHRGLAVAPGLSTTPSLSGALVRSCLERLPVARRAQITLFIGNRNSKGAAAIASVLGGGLTDPCPVRLPIGRRIAYRFPSADAGLLGKELGLAAEFRVAFEIPVAGGLLAGLSPYARRLSPVGRARLARLISAVAAPAGRLGSASGILQVELAAEGGQTAACALVGAGQRLPILPCALAFEGLLDGSLDGRGLIQPSTWLPPADWLHRLTARGLGFRSW